MPIQERGKNPSYQVRVKVNGKYVYMGTYENRRAAELIEMMWHHPKKNKENLKSVPAHLVKVAAENGINYTCLYNRVNYYNWSIEDAINIKPLPREKRPTFNKGLFMGLTVGELRIMKRNKVTKACLWQRVKKQGWSIEEAINTPPHKGNRNHNEAYKDIVVKYMLKHMQCSFQQLKNEFPHVSEDELKRIWDTFQ